MRQSDDPKLVTTEDLEQWLGANTRGRPTSELQLSWLRLWKRCLPRPFSTTAA